jgi:manganese/zinc/iron transport system substrate-binding protein
MRRKLFLIFKLIFLTLNFSCKKKKKIVCTTTMIADILQNIIDDKYEIVLLMNPGVDPHSYKATYSDLKNINEAEIVFFNGLHLEGKMSEVFEKSKNEKFIAISKNISKEKLIFDKKFGESSVDPHIWFDIDLWIECAFVVCEKMIEIDKNNENFYKKNYFLYKESLKNLDFYIKEKLKNIENKILISSHDAFSYFGRKYDIKVIGLQGISTISECGIKDIKQMVDFIIKNQVKSIFLETSVPESPMNAIVEGCKKKGYDLKIGGYLYSDSLGDKDSIGGTYIGMMKKNVEIFIDSF